MLSTPFCGANDRPSIQFSESRKDTCRCPRLEFVNQSLTVRKLLSSDYNSLHIELPHNMDATDRVEFSDVIAFAPQLTVIISENFKIH